MNIHLQTALEIGLTYQDYLELVNDLVANEKTSGPKQSPSLVGYTKLNASRMRRLNKKTTLSDVALAKISELKRPMTWLAITESWCGDAAQILPIINKLAETNPLIQLKHVLRDEHPELMDQFLTKGARSIPVVILIDDASQEVLGHWGPRPMELQDMVYARKEAANPGPYDEFQAGMQKWYTADKGQATTTEFLARLEKVITQEKIA